MAASLPETSSDARRAVATARLLARRANATEVGAEFLLAGVLRAADPDLARRLLRSAGVRAADAVLQAIPEVAPDQFDQLGPVKPDAHLTGLLGGELKEFMAGRIDAAQALQLLLAPAQRTEGIRAFLADPEALVRGAGHPEHAGTAHLLKRLTLFYQPRWLLGRLYHTPDAKTGLPDFATGTQDQAFGRSVDALYEDQVKACRELFSDPLYERSLLGRCWREQGELAAHTLGLVLLGEIGLVGRGPLPIREIAWSLSPKYFHRYLGVARDAIRQLEEREQVQSISGGKAQFLGEPIVPTPATLDEFLDYLRGEDPITARESEDLLKGLF